jgi:hypothetical protein
MIDQKKLREVVSYNPLTGKFTWTFSQTNAAPRQCSGEYIHIRIEGRLYRAHRLAFLWMNGQWPKGKVDHKDRDRSNNRWSNLREANHAQNMRNSKIRSDNKSNMKGVSWHKSSKKYRAQIRTDQGRLHLGVFDTAEAAHQAYKIASTKYHGQFSRHS